MQGIDQSSTVQKSGQNRAPQDNLPAHSESLAVPDSPQPQAAAIDQEHIFSAQDFSKLAVNEHFRYHSNNKKVGSAVIVEKNNGSELAFQYTIPHGHERNDPEVRPLINIEAIQRYGMKRYRATSPYRTTMFATRFIDCEYSDGGNSEKMRIACFSPPPPGEEEPFWGSNNRIPLFRQDLPPDKQQEFDQELAGIKPMFKGGRELDIDPDSARKREEMTRNPTQNRVMEGSAKEAYSDFLDAMIEELHPEMQVILNRAVHAPLNASFEGHYRPEWLHLEGFSLTPMSIDPQRKDNLAAGPKWANTQMMVLERIAKWCALNRPYAWVRIKPHFEMLLDTDIAQKINFSVTIEEKNRFVRCNPSQNFYAAKANLA